MTDQPTDPEQLVRKLYEVRQSFTLPDGELEFQIAYDGESKHKFVDLKSQVTPLGYRPELTGSMEECVLTLRKVVPTTKRLPRLPVFFALSTLGALAVSALLQQEIYHDLVPSLSNYVTFFAFGVTVAVLLGVHELVQRLMARKRDAGRANSYLIPGIPIIPPYLPTWGFATTQRDPALNRDSLFDTLVAGPLAVLGLTIVLYAVGSLTAVQSTVAFSQTPLVNSTVTINPNVIQISIGTLLTPFVRSVPAGYLAVSPLVDAATIGFILVFLWLLPIASYDGGLMATAAWGPRAARAAGYLSVLALLVFDTYTYWAIAVIGLILVGRPFQLKLLDEVSPLSSSRRWLLVGMLVVAFLCLPIPKNLATFPLG